MVAQAALVVLVAWPRLVDPVALEGLVAQVALLDFPGARHLRLAMVARSLGVAAEVVDLGAPEVVAASRRMIYT